VWGTVMDPPPQLTGRVCDDGRARARCWSLARARSMESQHIFVLQSKSVCISPLSHACHMFHPAPAGPVVHLNFCLAYPSAWLRPGRSGFDSRQCKITFLHIVQTYSEVHPVSYPVGNGGLVHRGLKRQERVADH
jgi:hypothetical protein